MMQNRFITIGLVTALLAWPSFSSPASAGGYEFPASPDARALGRGSASLARADDPFMALLNPAAVASMPAQFIVGTQMNFQKACVDRTGTYDSSAMGYVDGQAGVEHQEVCAGGDDIRDRFSLLPMIGGAIRLHKRVGMLLVLDPPMATREMIWEDSVRKGAGGQDIPGFYPKPPNVTATSPQNDGLTPSPLRYMLAKSDVVVLYPTIGIGVKLADWVQIGAGFSWGFARIKFTNYTRLLAEGENQTNDTPTDAKVRDWFLPRVVGSIHFIPHDRLDIVAGVRWDDDVRASGDTVATSLIGPATGEVSYTAPRPIWVNFGIRYAHRTTPRAKLKDAKGPGGATDDPMKNETFDIEANVIYERNRVVTDHLFNSADLTVPGTPPIVIPAFQNPLRIAHNWKDQVSVRVGADWNVMPGQLAIRLGASYETLGFNEGFGFIDYLPMQRFGIHGGLSGRFGAVEISLGYAFLHSTTFNNPNGQMKQIVIDLTGPRDPSTVNTVINSGTYNTRVHALAWSLRAVFD